MKAVALALPAVDERRFARRGVFIGNRRLTLPANLGFTLIELLVVIGLIALLVAGVGFSLSDRSGNNLTTAQQMLSAACGMARAQAALHQTEARVFIYAERPPNGDREKYLRLFQVARADPAGSDTWLPAGPALYLPHGVYLVPSAITDLVAPNASWPSTPPLVSTLPNASTPTELTNADFARAGNVLFLEFRPDGGAGLAAGETSLRLIIASAVMVGDLPQFTNSSAARGLLIRENGTTRMINDTREF